MRQQRVRSIGTRLLPPQRTAAQAPHEAFSGHALALLQGGANLALSALIHGVALLRGLRDAAAQVRHSGRLPGIWCTVTVLAQRRRRHSVGALQAANPSLTSQFSSASEHGTHLPSCMKMEAGDASDVGAAKWAAKAVAAAEAAAAAQTQPHPNTSAPRTLTPKPPAHSVHTELVVHSAEGAR